MLTPLLRRLHRSREFARAIRQPHRDAFTCAVRINTLNRNRKALNRRYNLPARFTNQSAAFEGPFLPKVG
jgi:hypothetical protein